MPNDISGISGLGVNYQEQISGSNTALGQMDFLELLMIQLQYQDPMSPMDSQAFSAQLAQFSQLEQVTQMNETLNASLQTDLLLAQSINNTMAATMIGQGLFAYGNEVELVEGQESMLNYNLAGSAQTVTIDIMNENGVTVRTMTVNGQSSGEQQYAWDGLDDDGNELAEGIYTFSVEATNAAGTTVQSTTYTSGMITGVTYVEGMAEFMVGSINVPLGSIYKVGEI